MEVEQDVEKEKEFFILLKHGFSCRDHAALFICGTVVMFIIVFLTQWLQYNKTYTELRLLLYAYKFTLISDIHITRAIISQVCQKNT